MFGTSIPSWLLSSPISYLLVPLTCCGVYNPCLCCLSANAGSIPLWLRQSSLGNACGPLCVSHSQADHERATGTGVGRFHQPQTGTKIFGCTSFFDHVAKINQSKCPWSQNVVSVGLLKIVKGRWTCLPLTLRFYHMKKQLTPETFRSMAECFLSELSSSGPLRCSLK